MYKAKNGRQQFLHPYKRLGLRYLQLHIYSNSATIYYAGVKPSLYPVINKPSFQCADSLHNKIYEVCRNTLLHCMHDHYEDCPWREQALYAMDARNQMLCGYYVFEGYDFAKANLKLLGLSIRCDDMLELCSPAKIPITIPTFSATYHLQLYEYLIHSKDKEFVQEMLPDAKRIVDMFISKQDEETGLIINFTEPSCMNLGKYDF